MASHPSVLFATTRNLQLPVDFKLLEHLPPNPLVFIRDGEGLVGYGVAAALTATGENRMRDLAEQWRALCETAVQEDPTPGTGRGLLAFGSVAFSANSATESRLIVPELIFGVRDGRAWLTRVSTDAASAAPALDESWVTPAAGGAAIELHPGEFGPAAFKTAVSRAVGTIHGGVLKKVVLARDLVGDAPADLDLRTVLARLATLYPSCWTYSVGEIFGASPELLVRVTHGQVSARVLAGTAGRGTDPGIDRAISAALVASAKNTEEHGYALQSLLATLEPFCQELDADPSPFAIALPNVWHLASDVHGVLSGEASVLDLAQALHPTAAVAGTPTKAAENLLAELEPFDRETYSGPVGWIGANGDGEWAIALRGATLREGKITAYAGCGIVADSDPEAELAETELKFAPIRQALG